MAPSGRRRRTTTATTTKTTTTKITKTATKKKTATTRTSRRQQPRRASSKSTVLPSSSQEYSSSTKESVENDIITPEVIDVVSNSACSTPKGNKFRIPEISTCPPAPKKPRVISSNCSLRRSPLSFFSPPDLELFFCVALRDVPV